MATVQEPRERARFESFLDERLETTRGRVRFADLAVGGFGLATLTLGFGLVMLALDRWLVLPAAVRQIAFLGFVLAAGWYVLRVLFTPLRNAVNPYFAAREIERTLPEAKNSLVNWLDLRERPLAPSIREALVRRAAGDVSKADLEEAVADRRTAVWGTLAGALAVAAVVMFLILRPAQFMSLFARTFFPFSATSIVAQTRITLVEPKAGDATVPIHQSVYVRVEVDGRVPKPNEPDAVRLALRYNPDDPAWEERLLEQTDRASEWAVRVPAAQVRRPSPAKPRVNPASAHGSGMWARLSGFFPNAIPIRIRVKKTRKQIRPRLQTMKSQALLPSGSAGDHAGTGEIASGVQRGNASGRLDDDRVKISGRVGLGAARRRP
jgi:hypothetical protein